MTFFSTSTVLIGLAFYLLGLFSHQFIKYLGFMLVGFGVMDLFLSGAGPANGWMVLFFPGVSLFAAGLCLLLEDKDFFNRAVLNEN